jgi:hypothetical protein
VQDDYPASERRCRFVPGRDHSSLWRARSMLSIRRFLGSRRTIRSRRDDAYGNIASNGFMYVVSFQDLDGHVWEVMWMDPAGIQKS